MTKQEEVAIFRDQIESLNGKAGGEKYLLVLIARLLVCIWEHQVN